MSAPIRLLIHGASGRMGRGLLRLAATDSRFAVVAAATRSGVAIDGVDVPIFASSALSDCPIFDIAIDFSLPAGFDAILGLCHERRAGLVCGTTGLADRQRRAMLEAGQAIPVVW